ncbi:hypothetical protein J3A83DRAFT_4369361 [Scleroderma citrinum]
MCTTGSARSIPHIIAQVSGFAQESKMYQNLLEMEYKLDWTVTRKKSRGSGLQDALARNSTILRVLLRRTLSSQAWHSCVVEGQLLEPPNQRFWDKIVSRKFSTFIKRIAVEIDRDSSLDWDGSVVEWPRAQSSQSALDSFTISCTDDT